jgi:integrase
MQDMPKPRFPHLLHERTNRGRWVWYFRIGKGPRIRLPDEYGSPEFVAAYHAALSGNPIEKTPGRPGKGSVAWLIARYRESSAWAGLSPATRYQRDRIFTQIIEKVGSEAYAGVTAKTIRNGREARQATPFMANNYLRAVKGLFAWATEAEFVTENPAAGVAELAVKTQGHEPWTIEDVRRYEARWPLGARERVWLHVLAYTGLRLGDACVVGWQHVRDGWVSMKAEKTGETLEFPILPPLEETLKAGPTSDLAWIANAHGRPFVKESFGNAFRDACRAAGIKGKSAHGLRKMLASLAAEIGASEELLQAWFGWQSNRMSAIYTRAASKKAMAGKLGELFRQNAFGTESPRAGVKGAGKNARRQKKTDT